MAADSKHDKNAIQDLVAHFRIHEANFSDEYLRNLVARHAAKARISERNAIGDSIIAFSEHDALDAETSRIIREIGQKLKGQVTFTSILNKKTCG